MVDLVIWSSGYLVIDLVNPVVSSLISSLMAVIDHLVLSTTSNAELAEIAEIFWVSSLRSQRSLR
jgi:hypothetical protein